MRIGDEIGFLSKSGGDIITGFQGRNTVLVEDEDGFQIPAPINEVVLAQEDDYSASKVVSSLSPKPTSVKQAVSHAEMGEEEEEIKQDPTDKEIIFRTPVEEHKGGDQLSCYLAFIPLDIKEVTHTRFECYFVNDSNYYVRFTYLAVEGQSWTLKATQEVEPDTKEFIDEFGHEDLSELGRVAIQLITYKREKPFILEPAVDVQFRIDPVKFYKLHTFEENDFFEQSALLYIIIENDKTARPLVVDPTALKAEMYQKTEQDHTKVVPSAKTQTDTYMSRYDDKRREGNPFVVKHRGDDNFLVVDLHANELLDSTAGMSTMDVLNYQQKKFRDTIAEYANKEGQKIIFIHGEGEGVLRRALINDLNCRYRKYPCRDASSQEYGYGATQVTIK